MTDPHLRTAHLPAVDDPQLALVLYLADNLAQQDARSHTIFRDWDACDQVVTEFIARWLPLPLARGDAT